MILLTRSMVQGMRSAAMNLARSLDGGRGGEVSLDRCAMGWVGG